jgi:two-component system, sensor histidine kinase and response regulator
MTVNMTENSAQASRPHTILIVGNNSVNPDATINNLDGQAYQLMIAQNGEDAVQRAALIQPDLILLDLMLPNEDCFEICRQLRTQTNTQNIPVILMLDPAEIKDNFTELAMNGIDFITKPLQINILPARVKLHMMLHIANKRLQPQTSQ